MSALTFLYFVLPFPVVFLIHELEEVFKQHKWLQKHKESVVSRFPAAQKVMAHLERLNTKAFAVAVVEELLALLVVTAAVTVLGWYGVFLWMAVFIGFSVHLLVHIAQALVVKGYVPGLVSAIILLPYTVVGCEMIFRTTESLSLFLECATFGVVLVALNLCFAHWLGIKVAPLLPFGKSN